ncbi:MAG: phosphate signaling complex protein PhoU [Actinocatenispora sp.]
MMREGYQVRLAAIGELLSAMADSVGRAMGEATRALLEADQAAAERVMAGEPGVDALRDRVEQSTYELLALQAPVASDLRMVLTAQHVAADLERMGDLADHVATTVLRRHPDHVLPPELNEVFATMAEVAGRMADKLARVIAERDVTRAAELDGDDDVMDALHRRMFGILVDGWPHGVAAAVDAALLGRFYERYADHAVNAGAQVIYLVTGEAPANA